MSREDEGRGASGPAIAGLTTGVIGTALGLANSGILGGNGNGGGIASFFGGGRAAHMHHERDMMGFGYAIDNERRIARLEAKQDAMEVAVKKDAEIAELRNALTGKDLRLFVDERTRHMVSGRVYLSPEQMADPYEAGRNVLVSRHIDGGQPPMPGPHPHPHDHCPPWDRWY